MRITLQSICLGVQNSSSYSNSCLHPSDLSATTSPFPSATPTSKATKFKKKRAAKSDESRKTTSSSEPSRQRLRATTRPRASFQRPGGAAPPHALPHVGVSLGQRLHAPLLPPRAGPQSRGGARAAVLRPSTYWGVACRAAGGVWGSFFGRLTFHILTL